MLSPARMSFSQKLTSTGSDPDSALTLTLCPMRTVVRNLRRKLGDDANNPNHIFTEPRVGYRVLKPGTGERVTNRE